MEIIILLLGIEFTLSLFGFIKDWHKYRFIAAGICTIIDFICMILLIGAL